MIYVGVISETEKSIENVGLGPENDGPSKFQGENDGHETEVPNATMKLQNTKMMGQFGKHENAGYENSGPICQT